MKATLIPRVRRAARAMFAPVIALSVFAVEASADDLGSLREAEGNAIHTVAMAGNAFRTQGNSGGMSRGAAAWSDPETVFSVFVAADEDVTAEIGLRARAGEGAAMAAVEIDGERRTREIAGADFEDVSFGSYELRGGAYTRIDISGVERTGDNFAAISDVLITVPSGADLAYVKDNQGNRYYWGRRGPSVHLRYAGFPEDRDIEWFYSEITVPAGEDPVGSFYMANGFSQGYFGFQVNSETERRVLFSVWSPYVTDDPSEIPPEQRIQVLDHGEDVYTGDFGNEGSGGQSYLVHDWSAGETYGFLNGARPDGNGNTVYTAYFRAPDGSGWRLIAQFLRPETDTWYTGAHSFLESFAASSGHRGRRAVYGNQWARDVDGVWREITEAVLTGDDIARVGYRLDFDGGREGDAFFLRNGGFFVGTTPLDSRFSRPARGVEPDVNPDDVPHMQP